MSKKNKKKIIKNLVNQSKELSKIVSLDDLRMIDDKIKVIFTWTERYFIPVKKEEYDEIIRIMHLEYNVYSQWELWEYYKFYYPSLHRMFVEKDIKKIPEKEKIFYIEDNEADTILIPENIKETFNLQDIQKDDDDGKYFLKELINNYPNIKKKLYNRVYRDRYFYPIIMEENNKEKYYFFKTGEFAMDVVNKLKEQVQDSIEITSSIRKILNLLKMSDKEDIIKYFITTKDWKDYLITSELFTIPPDIMTTVFSSIRSSYLKKNIRDFLICHIGEEHLSSHTAGLNTGIINKNAISLFITSIIPGCTGLPDLWFMINDAMLNPKKSSIILDDKKLYKYVQQRLEWDDSSETITILLSLLVVREYIYGLLKKSKKYQSQGQTVYVSHI